MGEWDQYRTPLFDAVKKYIDDKVIPLHVPGHKQGKGLEEFKNYAGEGMMLMDLCAIEELDYLNAPKGAILEAEELMAHAVRADNAFFLVNGTTSGIHAMIMTVCEPGDRIIVPRNAHKSIIGGTILSGAVPVFVQPEINENLDIAMGVELNRVKRAIDEHPEAKAVLVINPTYYGAASDLYSIVRFAHSRGMAVIVDEAHGAHMAFHKDFPVTAMEAGADMSAASFHKTGGSLTQSSVLLTRGPNISVEKVRQVMNVIETTSASYLLMCSLDVARKQLATKGYEMLDKTLELAAWARYEINKIPGLYAFGEDLIGSGGCYDFDRTKLGVNVRGLGYTGYEMESKLRKEYGIQVELSDLYNILAIVTIGDRKKDMEAFAAALKDIGKNPSKARLKSSAVLPESLKMAVSPRRAFYSPKKMVPLGQSAGEIAGEMVMAYPPGIPIICIGEMITEEVVEYIRILKREKCQLQGTSDPNVNYIKVLAASHMNES